MDDEGNCLTCGNYWYYCEHGRAAKIEWDAYWDAEGRARVTEWLARQDPRYFKV